MYLPISLVLEGIERRIPITVLVLKGGSGEWRNTHLISSSGPHMSMHGHTHPLLHSQRPPITLQT